MANFQPAATINYTGTVKGVPAVSIAAGGAVGGNLITQSENLSTWQLGNSGISPGILYLDGATQFWKLYETVPNASPQYHDMYSISPYVSVTAGDTITASMYMMAAERKKVNLYLDTPPWSPNNWPQANFDVSAGILISKTIRVDNAGIYEVGNIGASKVYRVYLTTTPATLSGSTYVATRTLLENDAQEFVGSPGAGVYATRAQVTKNVLSDYIKTTTTAIENTAKTTDAFNETVSFRDPVIPNGTLNAFSPNTGTATQDGNVVVDINYTYTDGARVADYYIIFYKQGGGTVSPANPCIVVNPASGVASTAKINVVPGSPYTFAFSSARVTKNGIIASSPQNQTARTVVTGNYTGSVGGSTAATVVTNAGNGATAFTGTSEIRNTAVPTNNATIGTITSAATVDGNVVITIPVAYTQSTVNADGVIVYYAEGASGANAKTNDHKGFSLDSDDSGTTRNVQFTLKPNQQYNFSVRAYRKAEGGRKYTAFSAVSTHTATAGNYTGNVYGTTAETLAQQPVFESYGPATFDFNGNTNGFTVANGNISASSDSLIVSPTVVDPRITKSNLSFSGATYQKVRARVKLSASPSSWDGNLFYSTSAGPSPHGISSSYAKFAALPSTPTNWNILEWDMNTSISPNDWLNSTISSLRIDLSQSIDANWEIDWISVGRTGIPTFGADYGSSPSTISGLSGDGENRIPMKYSGGFSVVEGDADITDKHKYQIWLGSPSKGAGVRYFSVLSGNVNNPGTGFYGSHAIKINFTGTTTNREVYFASSPAAYNIPLTPNSKWIVSGKGYVSSPSLSSLPLTAQLGLLTPTSPTTGYRASSVISAVHTWTDLSGVLNLVNDSSITGTFIAGATGTTSPTLWLDGLMLERKVGPGTTPTPWSKGSQYGILGSNKGNPNIPSGNIGVGVLLNGMTLNQGDGTPRPVLSGFSVGNVRDGENVIFSTPYSTIPTVVFFPGAQTTGSPFSNTTNVSTVCEAQNLTTSGFTAKIRFIGIAGSSSPITDTVNFGAGSPSVLSPGSPDTAGYTTAPSPAFSINKTNGAEAFDDKYKYTFNVTVNNRFMGPSEGYEPGNLNVGLYARKATGWYLVSTYGATGSGAGATTTKSVSPTVTIDGVIYSPAVGQAEFAIVNLSGSVGGLPAGTINSFASVSYSVANPPTDVTATATGSYPVPFAVIATSGSS